MLLLMWCYVMLRSMNWRKNHCCWWHSLKKDIFFMRKSKFMIFELIMILFKKNLLEQIIPDTTLICCALVLIHSKVLQSDWKWKTSSYSYNMKVWSNSIMVTMVTIIQFFNKYIHISDYLEKFFRLLFSIFWWKST